MKLETVDVYDLFNEEKEPNYGKFDMIYVGAEPKTKELHRHYIGTNYERSNE